MGARGHPGWGLPGSAGPQLKGMQAEGMQDAPGSEGPGPDTSTIPLTTTSIPWLRLEHPWTSSLPLRELEGRWSGSFSFSHFPSSHSQWEQERIPTQCLILGGFFRPASTKAGVKPAAHPKPAPPRVGGPALGCKQPLRRKLFPARKCCELLISSFPGDSPRGRDALPAAGGRISPGAAAEPGPAGPPQHDPGWSGVCSGWKSPWEGPEPVP